MAKKRKRKVPALPTPEAPLNLKANRRGARHGKQGLLLGDDELGRELAEEFVRSVTGGGNAADEVHEEEVPEEHGGPFILSPANVEFAEGTDESNPEDAEPSALPTVSPLRPK